MVDVARAVPGVVVPPSVDTFEAWLRFGLERGWVSDIICETHDLLPMNEEESAAFENGEDPCVPAVRVWQEVARWR